MSSDDDKTLPPGAGDEEEDKTILSPGTTPPAAEDDDDEKTIFAPTPASEPEPEPGAEDEDRTIISTTPPADEDRTIIATTPPAEDEDRTIISTTPPADEDRTIIATTPPADDDSTILSPMAGIGGDPDATIISAAPSDPDATVIAPRIPLDPAADPDATIVTGVGGAAVTGTGGPTLAPTTETGYPTSGPTHTQSFIPPLPGTPPAPLHSIEVGTLIGGQYRVDMQLDQGGMGRVYKGWDLNTDAEVAIKVILPEMAEDKKVADMFRREAKTLRQLHHDAIVRFFNYIPPNRELNLHALVMGYIEGTKLSDILKKDGPLHEDDAIRLTRRLAEGLEKAHELEIVHRDLSPDNVMLPGGDIDKAVLIDFGISRSEKIKDVTLGNEFAGKLKYVSPEQLGAYGNDARGTSDVYSLALLMIAMLIGKPLPMGDTIVEAVQMRQGIPDLTDVPVRFQEILYRMLQPDPSQRLSSMTEVAKELRILVDGETQGPVTIKDNVVEGLQAVPMAATATASEGVAIPAPEVPQKGSKGLGLVMGLVGLIAVGGGGYLYSTGAFDPPVVEVEEVDPFERTAGTRATFLAEFADAEGCSLAVLRGHGPQAGLIESYGGAGAIAGVGAAFATEFNVAPGTVAREVPEIFCPVLDTVRALQGTAGAGMEMSLDANTLPAGEGVVGRLHGAAGRQNWVALIDGEGKMFSLMRQLEDPIGDERRFSFRLRANQVGTFMVIATASEKPLVRAGAMQNRVAAADFLPLLLNEIIQDGQGAADVAFVEFTN